MKAWFNKQLSDCMLAEIQSYREKHDPKLCCELDYIKVQELLIHIVNNVQIWERELVFSIINHGSEWRICLVSVNELENLLRAHIKTEEVLSIVDPLTLNGFSVDFTQQENDSVEVLLAAWGGQEGIATSLNERFGGEGTFRGN